MSGTYAGYKHDCTKGHFHIEYNEDGYKFYYSVFPEIRLKEKNPHFTGDMIVVLANKYGTHMFKIVDSEGEFNTDRQLPLVDPEMIDRIVDEIRQKSNLQPH
jgi:hypothetical protein